MPIPRLQTYPAKVVSAPASILGAGHVIASLVFFYTFVADGTLFGVDNDPVYVLSFGIVFDHPLRGCFAVRRQMVFIVTHLALLIVTLACHH